MGTSLNMLQNLFLFASLVLLSLGSAAPIGHVASVTDDVCPGGSLSGCMGLCPGSPDSAFKACVQSCTTRCAAGPPSPPSPPAPPAPSPTKPCADQPLVNGIKPLAY